MAQGDPTQSGYVAGTPDSYLSARATTRTAGASIPVSTQEVTHGLVGPTSGRKAVAAAGTRIPLNATSLRARRVQIQYGEGSAGTVCVGGSTVVAALATRNGFALAAPGDWAEMDIADLNDVYIDSTVTGDYVTFNYWTLP